MKIKLGYKDGKNNPYKTFTAQFTKKDIPVVHGGKSQDPYLLLAYDEAIAQHNEGILYLTEITTRLGVSSEGNPTVPPNQLVGKVIAQRFMLDLMKLDFTSYIEDFRKFFNSCWKHHINLPRLTSEQQAYLLALYSLRLNVFAEYDETKRIKEKGLEYFSLLNASMANLERFPTADEYHALLWLHNYKNVELVDRIKFLQVFPPHDIVHFFEKQSAFLLIHKECEIYFFEYLSRFKTLDEASEELDSLPQEVIDSMFLAQ